MDVIGAGLLGVALQGVVSLLVWGLRVRGQIRSERQRGRLITQLAAHLQETGGRLLDQRADSSVLDLTVIGPHGDR